MHERRFKMHEMSFEEHEKIVDERLRSDYAYRRDFFNKAIIKQRNRRKVYTEDFAKKQLDYSCNKLASVDFCNRSCDQCALMYWHNIAIKEIKAGLRNPKDTMFESRGCYLTVEKLKNGKIRVTQYF